MGSRAGFCNRGDNPAIDRERRTSDIGGELETPGTSAETPAPRRRRRWKILRRLAAVVCILLVAGLVWLNGPGVRWLGPKVASHFLQKAGMQGEFTLEGSLTGGISVKDLQFKSDKALASLSLKRFTPVYQLNEVVKGRIQGIAIDGLHAELRLGAGADEVDEDEEKQSLDLDKLVQTVRSVRGRILPVAIDLTDISLRATRDGEAVIALAPSSLRHTAGDAAMTLNLGAITDAKGREWPAQESRIVWNEDDLTIEQIDPLPGIGVRNLLVKLPASGGPSAETELRVDDAVFMVGAAAGFASVTVDLREGRLPVAKLAERFGAEIPATAELTSLSVNVDGLLPDPKSATGEVRLLLENIVSGEWTVPELSLDVELGADRASVAASGQALGSGFSLTAEAPVAREGGGFKAGDVRGHVNVAEVSKLVAALADRVKAIDAEAPVPPSMVDGDFNISLKDQRPAGAEVDLVLKPADPAMVSSLALKGRWQPDQPVTAVIAVEGLKADANYNLETSSYQADVVFDSFNSARIDPWLAIVKAGTQGAVSLTGKWSGGGEVKAGQHRGNLSLAAVDLAREGLPPVNARGDVEYDWPAGFATRNLRIQAKEQTIGVDAKLAGGLLEMTNLSWRDRETEMAGGSAKLPVPGDFAKWREMLAEDRRPLEASIDSKVLSLSLLKDWLPAASRIDPRSTGRLQLKISGTYADPVIDVVVEAKDLRSPEQPKLPPADLKISLSGKEGRLSIDGSAIAPDFPAAVMTASMPFRPAEWAENPELIKTEPVSARVDLPRIDLSRFSSLVAAAKKISGSLSGNIEVAGELGKPAIKGKVDLTGGGVEMKDAGIPAITGVGLAVDLALDRITLKDLKASVAGGTLQGGGSLAIDNGKPGALDFRVRGNHLPLKRDDSLIVRANADLRLAGTLERAELSGTVGVVDSLFYRDIELLPIGTPFTAPSAASLPKIDAPANPASSVPEPFRNWGLNVGVRTENPFLIRGNIATGRVDVNLRVGGTLGAPAPDGEVKISDFQAALPFTTLRVRSGTVRFSPATGLDPVLEIRGMAEPRPYRVSVFVYGTASNPQLVLTSTPPLPENEIMTLLATGTTTTGLENPQAASSRAMQLLAEELRRGRFAVGKQLRPLLGLLDRVDFSLAEADPYTSESFSTATLMITDRWYLSAGMGAEGDSRVLGIWRLSFH
jgi:hypothetical protein